MKQLSLGIIFAAVLAVVFISCRDGKQGAPGPAGTSGQLLPYKSGSITATITGTTQLSGADFTQTANFQYFKNPTDNAISTYDSDGDYDMYSISRYDSVGGSYIKLAFTLDYYDADEDGVDEAHIYNTDVTVVYNKKVTETDAFYFGTCYGSYDPFDVATISISDESSSSESNITYDNIQVDNATGLITFDYSLELDYYDNSTGNNALMEGTVSVTPYNVSYRQGSGQ